MANVDELPAADSTFPSPPDSYVGARASSLRLLPSIQAALDELKEAEGRLIYAQHRVLEEYSRVFTAIRTVKTVVAHSIVLTPAEYHNLLDHVARRPIFSLHAATSAVSGGAGAGAGGAAGAHARAASSVSAASGAAVPGGGDVAPAHTCPKRSFWNYDTCAGCKHDYSLPDPYDND